MERVKELEKVIENIINEHQSSNEDKIHLEDKFAESLRKIGSFDMSFKFTLS